MVCRALIKPIRKLWPGFVRGLLCLCVLMGICAMLFPLPVAQLPSTSPEKDASEPFPCQNRPCGCRSAEQCCKKCCCFNNAQKISWAKVNHVEVPSCVLAAAKHESLSDLEICSLPRSSGCDAVAKKKPQGCSKCQRVFLIPCIHSRWLFAHTEFDDNIVIRTS